MLVWEPAKRNKELDPADGRGEHFLSVTLWEEVPEKPGNGRWFITTNICCADIPQTEQRSAAILEGEKKEKRGAYITSTVPITGYVQPTRSKIELK